MAKLAQNDREVRRGRGLSLQGDRGGDDHYPYAVGPGKEERRAERAVRLGDDRSGEDDLLRIVGEAVARDEPPSQPCPAGECSRGRLRRCAVLNVATGTLTSGALARPPVTARVAVGLSLTGSISLSVRKKP